MKPKISVIGLGVGYGVSCIYAAADYKVVGLDINSKILESPRMDSSEIRFKELHEDKIKKNLLLTTKYDEISDSDFVFVVVNTDFDKKLQQLTTDYVESALKSAVQVLKKDAVLIVLSTLSFGASNYLSDMCENKGIAYVYSPMMVAQGEYIETYINAPFIILGTNDKNAGEKVRKFFINFYDNLNIEAPRIFVTTPEVAELTKLIANAYLTTKITFANSIGEFCERIGIDGNLILEIIGCDSRIGHKFLKAGFSWAGQCFPRDIRSLITTCMEHGYHAKMIKTVEEVNLERTFYPLEVLKDFLKEKQSIAILGLTYKSGITDTRGSSSVMLVERLIRDGHTVETYDPNLPDQKKLGDVLKDSEIIIVTTSEGEFENIGPILGKKCKVVCDFADIVNKTFLPDTIAFFKAGKGWMDINNKKIQSCFKSSASNE